MKDEVFKFFNDEGIPFSVLKSKNRDIKSSHIKAGMVDVFHRRHLFRGDQLARAALRAAKEIDTREEYEQELKLNDAIKELERERVRSEVLKRQLFWLAVLEVWFVSVGLTILFSYLGFIK